MENEDKVENTDIQFAIFDGGEEITEAMYEEVKNFAAFINQRDGITSTNHPS